MEASSSLVDCVGDEDISEISRFTGNEACDFEVATLENDTFFACLGGGVRAGGGGLTFGLLNNCRFGGTSVLPGKLDREKCRVRGAFGLAVLSGIVLCDTGLRALGLTPRSVLGLAFRRIDLGLRALEFRGLGLRGRGLAARCVLKPALGLAALLGLGSLGLLLLRMVLGLLARGLVALGLSKRGLPGRGLNGRGEVRLGLTCAASLGLTTMEMLFSLECLTGKGSSGTLIPSPCTSDTSELR